MKLEISQQFFEKYSNIKILPLGAELFHEERQTDVTDMTLILAFRNLAKASKNAGPQEDSS